MSIFLERFVLTVLSGVVVSLVLLNVFKLDMRQRISLLVATVAAAYFVGHTLTMKRAAITQVSPPATEVPRKTGDATTTGPNSPAVTGDGNKIDYNQPPPSKEDKPKPPK